MGVTLFFVSNQALFALAMSSGTLRTVSVPLGPLAAILPTTSVQLMPVVFYVWVGLFNMMVVAQFWAFGNDIYTEEQGKRLFPMVGIGASIGAVMGAGRASRAPPRVRSPVARPRFIWVSYHCHPYT